MRITGGEWRSRRLHGPGKGKGRGKGQAIMYACDAGKSQAIWWEALSYMEEVGRLV